MPIFRQFVERLSPLVPSVLRKKTPVVIDDIGATTSSNILNLALVVGWQVLDALGDALAEQAEVSHPLATASGWVLDQHCAHCPTRSATASAALTSTSTPKTSPSSTRRGAAPPRRSRSST